MTAVRRRRQGMAGSILEQFAELKSDYEIGKASRYKWAKTGIMTLGSHADYHYRTEAAYFGAMEMARERTRNNPLVMQAVRRLVANVVGRGFVLDSDSDDKAIDDVNGYRRAESSRRGDEPFQLRRFEVDFRPPDGRADVQAGADSRSRRVHAYARSSCEAEEVLAAGIEQRSRERVCS